MKKFYFILMLCFISFFTHAQNDVKGNKEVYYGNKAYDKGDLKTAVADYQKGLQLNPNNDAARINLALAQSKLKQNDEAVKSFDEALKNNKDAQVNAKLNYDKGTTLANSKKYADAVKAFENSLRINPDDKNARENLQKAINELKQQQQQNQQNKQNKDNKKQQQQNKDNQQQNKQNKQDQQKQQQQQNQMSKDQAEQMLKALREQEKETQKKLDRQKAGGGIPKDGKDW